MGRGALGTSTGESIDIPPSRKFNFDPAFENDETFSCSAGIGMYGGPCSCLRPIDAAFNFCSCIAT